MRISIPRKYGNSFFYEMLFEALGYTHNKLQMISLSHAADLDFFKKFQMTALLLKNMKPLFSK
jgi:hypothetical protein